MPQHVDTRLKTPYPAEHGGCKTCAQAFPFRPISASDGDWPEAASTHRARRETRGPAAAAEAGSDGAAFNLVSLNYPQE